MCSILGRKTYTVLPPRARIKKSTDPRQIVRSAILYNRVAGRIAIKWMNAPIHDGSHW